MKNELILFEQVLYETLDGLKNSFVKAKNKYNEMFLEESDETFSVKKLNFEEKKLFDIVHKKLNIKKQTYLDLLESYKEYQKKPTFRLKDELTLKYEKDFRRKGIWTFDDLINTSKEEKETIVFEEKEEDNKIITEEEINSMLLPVNEWCKSYGFKLINPTGFTEEELDPNYKMGINDFAQKILYSKYEKMPLVLGEY